MGVGPSSESHKAKYNVAVLGAAGGIGQTLSLLMKQSKYIKSLRLCESPPIVPFLSLSLSNFVLNPVTIRNCRRYFSCSCSFILLELNVSRSRTHRRQSNRRISRYTMNRRYFPNGHRCGRGPLAHLHHRRSKRLLWERPNRGGFDWMRLSDHPSRDPAETRNDQRRFV